MNVDQFMNFLSKAAGSRQLILLAFILLLVLQFRLILRSSTGRKLKSTRRESYLRRFLSWLHGDLMPQVSTETLMCCAFLDQLSVLGKNGTVSDAAHWHAHRLMCKLEELANDEVQK